MIELTWAVNIPVDLLAELKVASDDYAEAVNELNQHKKANPSYNETTQHLFNSEYCLKVALQDVERKFCKFILEEAAK